MVGMEDEIEVYQLMYNLEAGANGQPEIATEESIKAKNSDIYDDLPANGGKLSYSW